jgi:hypothetical protein
MRGWAESLDDFRIQHESEIKSAPTLFQAAQMR